jgi:hypothetical protein
MRGLVLGFDVDGLLRLKGIDFDRVLLVSLIEVVLLLVFSLLADFYRVAFFFIWFCSFRRNMFSFVIPSYRFVTVMIPIALMLLIPGP